MKQRKSLFNKERAEILSSNNRGHFMRSEFKKMAENNAIAAHRFLGDFYEGGWKLAHTSSQVIDQCLNMEEIVNDIKLTFLLIMLRNCISDICCNLDSLERGHDRTVLNNLRMTFEDFCCALHMHDDNTIYEKFLCGKHSASKSIDPAGKLRLNNPEFKSIYGRLSKVSHHMLPQLLARQMVSREGLLSHLKPLVPNRLHIQVYPLMIIVDFLRSIGEFAEEMCLHLLPTPYFWIKPTERNLGTNEDILIRSLIQKAAPIFKITSRSETS
jgi:hypothetical protein